MRRFDLAIATSALLLIDMQERFLTAIPAIAADQPVGRNCRILLEAARLLGVPALISEQYPKGLGPTLPHLVATDPSVPRLEKTHFSCCDDAPLQAAIAGLDRSHVVVCGIEAHVCVLATAADLVARGHQVVVAGDAVASRSEASRELACQALRDLGILVLPTESIVLRWQRQAGIGAFKAIAQLIR
jgi:nicotinamidase-related amidase